MRVCRQCGHEKPLSEFYERKDQTPRTNTHFTICKRCKIAAAMERHWRVKYGVTPEQVDAMWSAQGGLCAICRQDLSRDRANVDHSHTTGKVRGLLCRDCNLALGYVDDDVDRLTSAIAYLKEHEK